MDKLDQLENRIIRLEKGIESLKSQSDPTYNNVRYIHSMICDLKDELKKIQSSLSGIARDIRDMNNNS